MTTLRPPVRTPYAVMIRDMPWGGPVTDHFCYWRKNLATALRECADAARSWAQLIGGQYPRIGWFVIDGRTGEHHHPTQITRGGTDHGESHPQPAVLY